MRLSKISDLCNTYKLYTLDLVAKFILAMIKDMVHMNEHLFFSSARE
jgi:hypothetical protein